MQSGSRPGKKTVKSAILPVNAKALKSAQPVLLRQLLAGLPASACLPATSRGGGLAAVSVSSRVRQAGAALASHVLLFGFGDGRTTQAALEIAKPDARVTVVVVDPANLEKVLAGQDLSASLCDTRLIILAGDLQQIASAMPAPDKGMVVMADPRGLPCAAGSLQPLVDMARELMAAQATKQDQYRTVLDNIEQNLDQIERAIPAGALGEALNGQPVLVIAPGPSLEISMPALVAATRPFTVALDTALRPLAAAGIVPDLAVTLDPTESNTAKFQGIAIEFPILFFGGARPEAVGQTAWPIFAWEQGGLFDGIHPGFQHSGPFHSDGSVLLATVDILLRAGVDPLVLVGADLALTFGKGHAAGAGAAAARAGVRAGAAGRTVPGKDGGQVPTSESLWRHRRRLNRRLQAETDGRVLDGSAAGARIGNTRRIDLGDWLAGQAFDPSHVQAASRKIRQLPARSGQDDGSMRQAVQTALLAARSGCEKTIERSRP